ncbi:MAG TPA: heme-binding protein [Candidatus Obscuribacter sp.]|nr:heme-binding protein [Candidatus Obscuribacter sp.]HNB21072.1 heme-binding protein [Candidatus Melainabacteria bacterium]
MRTKAWFFIGALGLAGVAAAAAASESLQHYEEPAYKTELEDGAFELRSYPAVIAASVQVAGNGDGAANNAFKILAGYIFGKNKAQKKIAMTAPVVQETSEKIAMTVPVTVEKLNMSMTMSFYMPSKYTLQSLPEPLDKRIKLSQVPPRKFAVLRFSGFATEGSCVLKEVELKRWMAARKLEQTGESMRAFYNPPWTLPFLRRNEIWIPL